MKTLHRVALVAFMAAGFSVSAQAAKPTIAPAAAAPGTIDVWVRGGGPRADTPPRARAQSLNLDLLPLVDSERFDAQYGARHNFRGIALASVIASFAPDPSLDVAILHFANGKPLDAAERGLMMPAMRFVSEPDAALLWQWLKAIATKPMPAYVAPAAGG